MSMHANVVKLKSSVRRLWVDYPPQHISMGNFATAFFSIHSLHYPACVDGLCATLVSAWHIVSVCLRERLSPLEYGKNDNAAAVSSKKTAFNAWLFLWSLNCLVPCNLYFFFLKYFFNICSKRSNVHNIQKSDNCSKVKTTTKMHGGEHIWKEPKNSIIKKQHKNYFF